MQYRGGRVHSEKITARSLNTARRRSLQYRNGGSAAMVGEITNVGFLPIVLRRLGVEMKAACW